MVYKLDVNTYIRGTINQGAQNFNENMKSKRIQENCSTSSDGRGTCLTVDISWILARPSEILDSEG